MRNSINNSPVYLFLLPVVFFLHGFNQLPFFIHFDSTLNPLMISISAGIMCFSLFWLLTGSISKAGISVFFFLTVYLYFGVFHDFLKSVFGKGLLTSYKVVLPAIMVVVILALRYSFRRDARIHKLSKFLHVLMWAFLLIEVISFLRNLYNYRSDHNLIDNDFSLSRSYQVSNLLDADKPDIYFLVFDEYTSNPALHTLWQFDNSAITHWLKEQGFYVADSSKANYNFTPYSLSSSLNMRYIDRRKGDIGNNAFYTLKALKSLTKNETWEILKKENYRFYFKSPLENNVETFKGVKVLNQFPYTQLYTTTLLYRVKKDILWNFTKNAIVKKIVSAEKTDRESLASQSAEDVFATISAIKATTDTNTNRQPKFVFGHLLVTHEPHLFDSAGNFAFDKSRQSFDTYVDQVKFANKIIIDLVSYLQKNNKKNTIIILGGDHGFRDLPEDKNHFQFPNLSTYYFPGRDYSKLYPKISPVNTFRVIFNNFFNRQYPLLPDSSVFVNNIFSNKESFPP